MRTPYIFIVPFVLAMFLAACSDGFDGGRDSAADLGAAPTMGPIYNAPVRAFRAGEFDPAAADNTPAAIDIGDANTGSDGRVGVQSIAIGNFPVVLEVELTDASSYYDESSLSDTSIPESLRGATLHALVPGPQAQPLVAVTPLTEIAYRAAVDRGLFPMTPDAAAALNEVVRAALASELRSVLSPPTVFDANASNGTLDADEGGRYAMLLAALARFGAGRDAPGLRNALDLLADIADDGTINASDVANETYGSNFAAALQDAIEAIAANFGTAALQAEAALRNAVATSFDFSGVSNGAPGGGDGGGGPGSTGTISGTIDGTTRSFSNLPFAGIGPGNNVLFRTNGALPIMFWELAIPPQSGSYACSGPEGVVINYGNGDPFNGVNPFMYTSGGEGSCTLNVTRDGNTLSGTFSGSLVDGNGGAHPITNGSFNTLVPPNTPPDANANAGGDDNDNGGRKEAVGTGSAVGTIDGTRENITEQATVREEQGYFGLSAFQTDPQRNWGLQFPLSVGSHDCSPRTSTFIQFGKNFLKDDMLSVQALGNDSGSCTIVVTSIDDDTVTGTFTGVLLDNKDQAFPVTNGQFQAQRPK